MDELARVVIELMYIPRPSIRNSHQVEDIGSVMRILIANIADKDAPLVVPAFEVTTSQLQYRF